MSTEIKIVVTNKSSKQKEIFFFQQPAKYNGEEGVYSNSILSTPLPPFSESGSKYEFGVREIYYAGVVEVKGEIIPGKPYGFMTARQLVDLAPAAGAGEIKPNCVNVKINPLGIEAAKIDPTVAAGAFRICSPVFDPERKRYLAGAAIEKSDESIVLSSFVEMESNTRLDCQPVIKFYVATGAYQAGTIMNFISSSRSAAECDATEGRTKFHVSLEPDNTWKVKSFFDDDSLKEHLESLR